MSCSITTEQVKQRIKTVTRRNGWWFLKAGDIVQLVEKAMGLKKCEKIRRIWKVRIISTRREPLNAITPEDVIKEGFPDWTPRQFVKMYSKHNRCPEDHPVNRIEWEYLPIFKLHHQEIKTGKSELMAQSPEIENQVMFESWVHDCKQRLKQPPKGWIWMICNEKSRHFVKTTT